MIPVPVTLGASAGAALVNGWLAARIGNLRRELRVGVGDGGSEPLLRRMRAQANFVETTAFFLFLVVALELSGANRLVLAVAAALFILARILHGIGMDGGSKGRLRMYGMMTTSFLTIALIIWAIGLLGLQLLGS